jgi:hypothetical protein
MKQDFLHNLYDKSNIFVLGLPFFSPTSVSLHFTKLYLGPSWWQPRKVILPTDHVIVNRVILGEGL